MTLIRRLELQSTAEDLRRAAERLTSLGAHALALKLRGIAQQVVLQAENDRRVQWPTS